MLRCGSLRGRFNGGIGAWGRPWGLSSQFCSIKSLYGVSSLISRRVWLSRGVKFKLILWGWSSQVGGGSTRKCLCNYGVREGGQPVWRAEEGEECKCWSCEAAQCPRVIKTWILLWFTKVTKRIHVIHCQIFKALKHLTGNVGCPPPNRGYIIHM